VSERRDRSIGAVRDDTVPIAEAMGRVLRSLEGPRARSGPAGPGDGQGVRAVGGVFGRWDEAVGEAMARHVQPVKLDGDRLVVEVSEPAWATQVRVLADRIRERLAEVAGARIDVIEVRVAGAPNGRRGGPNRR